MPKNSLSFDDLQFLDPRIIKMYCPFIRSNNKRCQRKIEIYNDSDTYRVNYGWSGTERSKSEDFCQ
jgi:hypothetical protein